MKDLKKLEENIGYHFKDLKLLQEALTHSSYKNEHKWEGKDNERLEFLGDAVLELGVSRGLFHKFPEKNEGELTTLRASIVCEASLNFCSRAIELDKYLLLGKGEEKSGGRKRPSLISDVLEALIGAIYLDGGVERAFQFVEEHILNDLDRKTLFYDSKTKLQEVVHKLYQDEPVYKLISESGPDHQKEFCVEAYVGNQKLGSGKGSSKKAAQQEAAYQGLLKLKG